MSVRIRVPPVTSFDLGRPVQIQIDHNALWHALKKEAFHSSILEMELGSATSKVLLRDVQYHPFRQLVQHIDFQRVDAKTRLHMKVPLHFKGEEESEAVKTAHNRVNRVNTELEISSVAADLPEFIEVDLSGLKKNGTVTLKDIKLPRGVKWVGHGKQDLVLASATALGDPIEQLLNSDGPLAEGDRAPAPEGGDGRARLEMPGLHPEYFPSFLIEPLQRQAELRGTPSTQMSKLLKAFGIATEAMPKKELEKGWSELRSAFKAFAADEGLISMSTLAGEVSHASNEVSLSDIHEPGFEAAVQKGAEFRTAVLQRPEMLGAAEMAKALGITRQAVWARRKAKQILGVSNGRTVRYPAWQMDPKIAAFMPTILETLGSLGDWAIYLFMTQANPLLDEDVPVKALLSGESDRVMAAVRSYSISMA